MDKLIIAACDTILADVKRDIKIIRTAAEKIDFYPEIKVEDWKLNFLATRFVDLQYQGPGPRHGYCPLLDRQPLHDYNKILDLGTVWPKLHAKAMKQLDRHKRQLGSLHMRYLKQQKPVQSFIRVKNYDFWSHIWGMGQVAFILGMWWVIYDYVLRPIWERY